MVRIEPTQTGGLTRMHGGRVAMRDDSDTVMEEYKRFLDVAESPFALEEV